MFWDRVAGVYDLFVNIYNRKVHEELKRIVAREIRADDTVLECACGTGMLTAVIAPRCRHITATDFSRKMLEQTRKKCQDYSNVKVEPADILSLDYPDHTFDVVLAANVIHLLDNPLKALDELKRVCRAGGKIIIPTYMNKEKTGQASQFSKTVGKAGADFKQAFTFTSYKQFFLNAGCEEVTYHMIKGRVPCAVAVIQYNSDKNSG
ncbi:MAG: class I SAM-dependent methyltransferase [Eubacterium sp.]|nr:class I SAM-dependent methyltransferase [Eubacterium sp.]